MPSLFAINMNFNKAKRQADELDRIASELRNLANSDLSETLSELSSGWTGDSANLFIGKGENLKSHILTTANQLQSAANALRQNATAIYNAERKAELIAIERRRASSGSGGGGGHSF